MITPLLLVAAESHTTAALPFAGGVALASSLRCPGFERVNEDAVALLPVAERAGVVVIADGMGGGRAGDAASRLAVQCVATALAGVEADENALRAAVVNGIEQANGAILGLGLGAATTLSAVALFDGRARPLHVGDSDILLFGQRGRVHHRSISHGPTGFAVEAGVLAAEDAVLHDERHLVSNMVGSRDMRIELGPALTLAARDTLLLASDGLTDNLYVEEIVEHARRGPLDKAAAALNTHALARMTGDEPGQPSKPDDLSLVLFRSR